MSFESWLSCYQADVVCRLQLLETTIQRMRIQREREARKAQLWAEVEARYPTYSARYVQ